MLSLTVGCLLLASAGCSILARSAAAPEHFAAEQTNSGPEQYGSWFGDSDGKVLYFGLSSFWQLLWQCEAEGGSLCALRDLDHPGDHLIGRFDLAGEGFLDPLMVRRSGRDCRSSVWDVLAHSNGRIYYTTGWEEFGSVRPDGTGLSYYAGAGEGLNELWEGPAGEIYATRYFGSTSGSPDEKTASWSTP